MKNGFLMSAIAVASLFLAGCNDDDDKKSDPVIPPAASSVAPVSSSSAAVVSSSSAAVVSNSSAAVSSSSVAVSSSSAAVSSSSVASSSSAAAFSHPNVTKDAQDNYLITGVIKQNLHLTADKKWVIDGNVVVGEGAAELSAAQQNALKGKGPVLTIDKGVHVKATPSGVLMISRGSKIMAEGTADQPITFSSIKDADFNGEGEWGGVVVLGFAPYYALGAVTPCSPCNIKIEGFGTTNFFFGGDDWADNSGVIRYVRIAEAGKVAGPNSEVNGLTLGGVGHGTKLEYIQVHENLDDGIEWFGGAADIKYAVLTNNDDDDVDYDNGYRGNMQHVFIRKHPTKLAPTGSNDPRGIEANSGGADKVASTEAVLANFTIIGSEVNKAVNSAGKGKQSGVVLRGAVTTQLWNSAVYNFSNCVETADGSKATVKNILNNCDDKSHVQKNAEGQGVWATDSFLTLTKINFSADWAITNAEAKLATTIEDIVPVNNGSNFVFDKTNYVGAVNPDSMASGAAWMQVWTIPGSLNP
jgi:hypothetical protein